MNGRMKMRLRKARSKHDGQIDVTVSDTDDVYESDVVVWFDNVGVVMNDREAAALAAAITSGRVS